MSRLALDGLLAGRSTDAAAPDAVQVPAKKQRVDHLEYRSLSPHHPDWAHSDLYVTFRKAIDPDAERNFLEI